MHIFMQDPVHTTYLYTIYCFIYIWVGKNWWMQGGGGMWKRDQHLLFFFFLEPCLTPPSPYLPNIVCFFHIYVFSDVFWSSNIVFDISNLHGAYYYAFCTINSALWSWLCSWGMSSYEVRIGNPYTQCETMCHPL